MDQQDPMLMNLKEAYESGAWQNSEEEIKEDTYQAMARFESIRQELSSAEFKNQLYADS